MYYWLKFVWHRGSWKEFSYWSAYLVFVLWIKLLRNTRGFKIFLHLYIKYGTYLSEKRLGLSYHFKEDLHVYTDLCDKLHEMKLTFSCWGDSPTKTFHPSSSTRRAQLNVVATTVRSTDLLNCNVKTWVNTD